MEPGARRLTQQLIVLVPVLVTTYALGTRGVPLLPRMAAGVGVGMVLMVLVYLWERKHRS